MQFSELMSKYIKLNQKHVQGHIRILYAPRPVGILPTTHLILKMLTCILYQKTADIITVMISVVYI